MLHLSPHDMTAIGLSLRVAATATLVTLPLGLFTAYIMAFTKFPGKSLLEGVVNLPLVLPPVVTGYLLLLLFGQTGPVGHILQSMGIEIVFSLTGAIIASSVVGFPLLVRAVRIGMDSIDRRYLQAARTLGATKFDTIMTIIIPLSKRAIMGGMTLMFARSLGEFGATIILAGNIPGVTQTIPLAIYEYTSTPGGDEMALTLCLVSIVLSFTVLIISESSSKRQQEIK